MRLAGLISMVVERSALIEDLRASRSALQVAHDVLAEQATSDPLTGMWNRRAITAFLETMIAQGRRHARSGAVLMADIDNFKAVNDTHGHPTGDVVLREVARRFSSTLRAGDHVGRFGGEEFLICLADCSRDDAVHCADRLVQTLRDSAIAVGESVVTPTVSIGVAHRDDLSATDITLLIQEADAALYAAKQAGRDRAVVA
jgi:two-component system, cell cycle response regulator